MQSIHLLDPFSSSKIPMIPSTEVSAVGRALMLWTSPSAAAFRGLISFFLILWLFWYHLWCLICFPISCPDAWFSKTSQSGVTLFYSNNHQVFLADGLGEKWGGKTETPSHLKGFLKLRVCVRKHFSIKAAKTTLWVSQTTSQGLSNFSITRKMAFFWPVIH